MFYRLVRMLGHGIEPIFVFDGPKKPEFKRNKRSGRGDGARVSDATAKKLIQHFGFIGHQAPGEAEAECALLQRNGTVDAVLSEDVDTIMFGCGKTFRNWSSEGSTSKTPTHVTVYDAAKITAGHTGLDREGMVLIALMSGGDYIPEGIPGCGIKVACEAARAGFGRDVCRLRRSDTEGLNKWRQKLTAELKNNESGLFRTKHRALVVPADFPNLDVLRYYTHPVVSNEAALKQLNEKLLTQRNINIDALREFVAETFEWHYKQGAAKFIRVLAPSMLVQRLVKRFEAPDLHGDDFDAKEESEASIVKKIASRRTHASTDGTPELRVSFIPARIVGIDLSLETEEPPTSSGRSGLALNSDDDFEEEGGETEKKTTSKKPFDPSEADLAWIPESIVEMGVPLMAGDFKDQQRSKQAAKDQKAAKPKGTRAKKTTTTTESGRIDQYMNKVVKLPASTAPIPNTKQVSSQKSLPRVFQKASSQTSSLEPVDLDDDYDLPSLSRAAKPATIPAKKPISPAAKKGTQPKKGAKAKAGVSSGINPWTIANSGRTPSKPSAAAPVTTKPRPVSNSPIIISSSPAVPTKIPPPLKSFGRVTPTRRNSTASSTGSTSSDEPASPTPGARTRPPRSVAKELSASPTQIQQPPRRARQFKRTKSGAEEDPEGFEPEPLHTPSTRLPSTQPPSTQTKLVQTKLKPLPPPSTKPKPTAAPKARPTSLHVPIPRIKGYMPVAKRATATAPAKPASDDPIIILDSSSDEEDEGLPNLLKKRRDPHKPAPAPSTTRQPTKTQPKNPPPPPPPPPPIQPPTTTSPTPRHTSLPLRPSVERRQASDALLEKRVAQLEERVSLLEEEGSLLEEGNDDIIGDISGFSEYFSSGGKAWRRREIDVVDLTGDDGGGGEGGGWV